MIIRTLLLPFLCWMFIISAIRADENERKDLGYPGISHEKMGGLKQGAALPGHDGPTGSGIIYATENIPRIAYPPFEGDYYEAMIPDTLDLAERCALAVHGLTATADPAADYECYCWMGKFREVDQGGVKTGILAMEHSYNDYNGLQPKWIEALPLLRTASGSMENIDVDQRMMEILFYMTDKEGLYRIPVEGAPWDDMKTDAPTRQIWNSWPAGRALMAVCAWYSRDPNETYKEAIARMVDGLAKVAIYDKDYGYFTERMFDDRLMTKEKPHPFSASMLLSTIMTGLADAFRTTGYPPARELGTKLARFLVRESGMFKPDGSWTPVHFHGTTHMLLGLLEFGRATGDDEMVAFVRKAYEFGRAQGVVELGWFPEVYPTRHACMEPCQVGDMTALAVKLSVADLGDYWEDVEHYTRNLLQASQLTDTWWMDRMADQSPQGGPVRPIYETADRVSERIRGTFIGLTAAGGYFQPIAVGCCTGNGARALYFAWRHIVDEKDGELRVNLLLNRASQWADVDSYLPYQGKVEIKMKKDERLAVRIPSWVKEGQIKCRVGADETPCALEGRYLRVGPVQAGKIVTVEFPLKHETLRATIAVRLTQSGRPQPDGRNDKTYTLDVKGFDVVDIWPRDLNPTSDVKITDWIFGRVDDVRPENYVVYPFFTDPAPRGDIPRFVQARRFAPVNEMEW